MYDIHENTWQPMPELNTGRVSASIISILTYDGKDNTFVFGGADQQNKTLTTIENLEPNAQDWQTLSISLPGQGFQSAGLFEIDHG